MNRIWNSEDYVSIILHRVKALYFALWLSVRLVRLFEGSYSTCLVLVRAYLLRIHSVAALLFMYFNCTA